MAAKKITARDVAERAGVSQSAVSMILNRYPGIRFSEETRNRVLQVCEELGYRVPAKKTVISVKERVLLVVCPSYENYHYSRMLNEIQLYAKSQNYSVLAFNTLRDPGTEEIIPELCRAMSVAGIILLYNPLNSDAVERLAKLLPVVMIYDRGVQQGQDVVELDNYRVGELMGLHLLELGHRQIAAVFPSLKASHLGRKRRIEGIESAYRRKGLDPSGLLHVYSADRKDERTGEKSSYDAGFRITSEVLAEKTPVTAFIANNDMTAYGIMNAIYEQGGRIPEDYSVIGCDNLMVSGFQKISLTTVEPYSVQRAREAVNIAIRKIEHRWDQKEIDEAPEGTVRVAYAPRLIERGSTGKR